MTIKIHHLVAASDGKSYTELTHIYAETYEQALQEAREWHKGYAHLPILTVRAQPQGFQAGFRRLPGRVEETMWLRWRVKELLIEQGISMKQLAEQSQVSYRTICRLCHTPFHLGNATTREKLAIALGVSPAQMTEMIAVTSEVAECSGERTRC